MTRTLHDALSELAEEVVPRTVSAPVDSRRRDPWQRARTRRRVRRAVAAGAGLVATAAALAVVQGGSFGVPGRQVKPASVPAGPGSLPDRIFPTRASILSVEQAPIGRAALVYMGPWMLGAAAGDPASARPIAVGADSDVYRVLPAASTWTLAPDGRTFAYLEPGAAAGLVPARLHLLDLASGQDRVVTLPDRGRGLAGQNTLFFAPDSRHVLAAVYAQNPDSGGSPGGAFQRFEDVDVAAGTVRWREGDGTGVLGWVGVADLLVQSRAGSTGNAAADLPAGTMSVVQAQTGDLVDRLGSAGQLGPGGIGVGPQTWVSPDGSQVASTPQPNNAGSDGAVKVVAVASGSTLFLPDVRFGALGQQSVGATVAWRPVGWVSPATVVISRLSRSSSDPAGPADFSLWTWPAAGSGVLSSATPRTLGPFQRVLSSAAAAAQVVDVEVAADVLAGGRVRHAEPPARPLLDGRTLLPAVATWVAHDVVWTVLLIVVLLALAGAGPLRRRAVRRRR